jgi:hypothetical protein
MIAVDKVYARSQEVNKERGEQQALASIVKSVGERRAQVIFEGLVSPKTGKISQP